MSSRVSDIKDFKMILKTDVKYKLFKSQKLYYNRQKNNLFNDFKNVHLFNVLL